MTHAPILLFLDFGGGEIIIILLVILVILGPDKIPEFAKKAGQVMRYVRNATDDIKKEINKETDEIQKPFKSAYKEATSFADNAKKAMNTTLEDINKEEEEIKKAVDHIKPDKKSSTQQ